MQVLDPHLVDSGRLGEPFKMPIKRIRLPSQVNLLEQTTQHLFTTIIEKVLKNILHQRKLSSGLLTVMETNPKDCIPYLMLYRLLIIPLPWLRIKSCPPPVLTSHEAKALQM